MIMFRCLQINLNRSFGAQNLLLQYMAERDAQVAIVSEPNNNSTGTSPTWLVDLTGLAVIVWKPSLPFRCVCVHRGRGFVLARCGDIVVASCYFSPNLPFADYDLVMQELLEALRAVSPTPILVAGDFNARSTLWGCNTNSSSAEYLNDVMNMLDLRLINLDCTPTCVRPQGCSVIDLVWASPGLQARIRAWRVLCEVESLSDHRYLEYEVHPAGTGSGVRSCIAHKLPRWAMKKFNTDKFLGALCAWGWNPVNPTTGTPNELACDITRVVTDACDFAAPRVRYVKRRCVYWWNDNIASLRTQCNHCRRQFTRCNKRGTDEEKRTSKREYKSARKLLRRAIWDSKKAAWQELLDDLNRDPWGRPYRMVVKKLHTFAGSATETLDSDELGALLDDLFPCGLNLDSESMDALVDVSPPSPLEEDLHISAEEVLGAFKRKRMRRTAPGPDGIGKEVWLMAPDELLRLVAVLFTNCLQTGTFPDTWKIAILTLIPKPVADGAKAKFRPICLLDDIGKAFERLLANRILSALHGPNGGGISKRQFGFREGLSTIEALFTMREYITRARSEDMYVVAISLDISNAFNTLSWRAVLRQMRRKRLPEYLVRIIRNYFSDRYILYKDSSGRYQRRKVETGVPQGSVLGPLLWNLTYDWVLETKGWSGCSLICYADDTMVLASGRSPQVAASKATVYAGSVVYRLESLGLRIAAEKTEVALFGGRGPFPDLNVIIGGEQIEVRPVVRHLGVMLDRGLTFKAHMTYIEGKAQKLMRAMWRLLPNLKGPSAQKRQLYAGVLHSVMLYASPLWSDSATRWTTYRAPLLKIQRHMALRIISGYRTISYEAAFLLARVPPIHLLAARQRRIYERMRDLRQRQECTLEARAEVVQAADLLLRRQWYAMLDQESSPGKRVREAILPLFGRWLDHRGAYMNYHMTQLFTGHGSFGQYLHRIGRRECPACHSCNVAQDTVEHLLEDCPRWVSERHALRIEFGEDLPLQWVNMMPGALDSEAKWRAIATFARTVLTAREVAEREGGTS